MIVMGMCSQNGCWVFSDIFALDDLASDYSIRSGSWAISDGLNCTSASGLITCNTAYSGLATGVHTSVVVSCATTSDKARLVFCYVDDNNYWYVEVQPGAVNGTMKLFKRAAGSDTQKGTTKNIFGWTGGAPSGPLCASATSGNVMVTCSGAYISVSDSPTIASTKCGMGTGTGSSNVTFSLFLIKTHYVDNHNCSACTACPTICSTEAQSVSITFSGITAGSGTAPTSCAAQGGNANDYNDTWVVPRSTSEGGACSGSVTFTALCDTNDMPPGTDAVSWAFTIASGPTTVFTAGFSGRANVGGIPFTFGANFQQTFDAPAQCTGLTLSGLEPLLPADQIFIDTTGATCDVETE